MSFNSDVTIVVATVKIYKGPNTWLSFNWEYDAGWRLIANYFTVTTFAIKYSLNACLMPIWKD